MKLDEIKKCQRCKRELPENLFYSKGILRKSCLKCREYRRKKKNNKKSKKIKQPIKIKYSKKMKEKLNLIDSESDSDIICYFD